MNIQKSLPTQLPRLRFLDLFMEGHKGYIAGGCFKHLFRGEKIKDVDVFVNEADAKEADSMFSKTKGLNITTGTNGLRGTSARRPALFAN